MANASRPTAIEIGTDAQALARDYADWLVQKIDAAAAPFRMAVCGGSTPQPLYRMLGSEQFRDRIDWTKLQLYWGDERFVPHDDKESNFRLVRELWLDQVPLTPEQCHPIPTDGGLEDCAARYETMLKADYGNDTLNPARPLFDIMLLGVGEDGHTASLIPGQPVLEETTRWVAPMPTGMPQQRITLTYPAIAASRFVTFFVTGPKKATIVARIMAGDHDLPAARVTSDGQLLWFLDIAAASQLT